MPQDNAATMPAPSRCSTSVKRADDMSARWSLPIAVLSGLAAISVHAPCARADEGGVSFWAPGQMGSFSAVPGDPGFALPVVYLHASAGSDASKAFVTGGRLVFDLDAT